MPTKVAYDDTRLPPSPTHGQPLPRPGEDCEVLTESLNNDDPTGWWPGTIKMMKGDFYVVDYKIHDEIKYSDIVASDKIRSPNRK